VTCLSASVAGVSGVFDSTGRFMAVLAGRWLALETAVDRLYP
jgi:hypothetical protein